MTNPDSRTYEFEGEITLEQEEASRLKLGLPHKYVERLHVQGMLWRLKDYVKEVEVSTGEQPTALNMLTWAEENLRKIEGRSL